MTGLSVATRDIPANGMGAHCEAMKTDWSLVQRRRSIRMCSVLVNVFVSVFYGFFLYSSLGFWLKTGSLLGMGLVVFNTLVVGCLLTRRNASHVTQSIPNWILASLAQVAPLLLRPIGSASGIVVLVSTTGQVLALTIMIASLAVLNRSVGIVAANRGIKTRGPYTWIRHPLYAGEILFDIFFLMSNWGHQNILLILAITLAQVARALQEEKLLLRDERYVLYRAAVPYRLLPGIF